MKILIYTQNNCPKCEEAKAFFMAHHIEWSEINISSNQKAKKTLIHELNSYTTPTILINNQVIRGFDLEALLSLLTKK